MSPHVASLPREPRQPPSAQTTQTFALIAPEFVFLFRLGGAYDTHPSSASVRHRYLLPRIRPHSLRTAVPAFCPPPRVLRAILLSPLPSSSQRTVAKTGKRDGRRKLIALPFHEDKPPTVFERKMLFVRQIRPCRYVLRTSGRYSRMQKWVASPTFTGSSRTENRANKYRVLC